jgi:hypothetical protein
MAAAETLSLPFSHTAAQAWASSEVRGPDFFLVGAPKCGTTAFHRWLRMHPEVFLPVEKESHGFAPDLDLERVAGQAYLRLFEAAGDARRVGETSVFYLYSRQAAREIFDFNPEAQIVVMLRNPVDVMHAYHSERLWRGTENIRDFAAALAADGERQAGRMLPEGVRFLEGLRYRELATFSVQVERYLETFGPDRVHVVLHDDMVRDIAGVYAETCRFLDVDPAHQPSFSLVNSNKTVRSTRLQTALRDRNTVLWRAARIVPFELRRKIQRRLKALNTRFEPRAPMQPELRRKLQAEFRSEVRRLGELIGRDLSHWSEA